MIYSPTALMFFLRYLAFFFSCRWFEAWKSVEGKTEKSDGESSKIVFAPPSPKKGFCPKNRSINLTAKGGLLSFTDYQTHGVESLKDSGDWDA